MTGLRAALVASPARPAYPYNAELASPRRYPDLVGFLGKARELSEAFYLKLQEAAHEWIDFGTTKTAMIYGTDKVPFTNHE